MADKTPIELLAEKNKLSPTPVSVPGEAPQSQMADDPPQSISDYTKREIEAGKAGNDVWNKRRQAELDLGKKLVSKR